mmetsp:Transcript_65054/g.121185  ORF Transcript_65054/g.121185 Transcript_65054/m.121185 type:complete len:453 (-) Transcript_65054:119-1477(-)
MGPPNMGAPVGQLITPLSHVKTSPKWSIKGRRDGARASSATPGPGSYGLTDPSDWKVAKQPAFGFGSSHRNGQLRPATAPGPGQYSLGNPHSRASPTWGFGSSRRAASSQHDTPGPGSYVTPLRDGGFKFSMTSRRDVATPVTDTEGPGPGEYTTTKQTHSRAAPSYGFGTSKRSHSADTAGPGPGAYVAGVAPIIPTPPRVSMTPRRNTGGRRQATPGPGEYKADAGSELISKHSAPPRWGFGAAHRKQTGNEDTPGPGFYGTPDAESVRKTTPKYSLGGARRDGSATSGARPSTPGPGQYGGAAAVADGKHASPQWVFGTSGRGAIGNVDGPGPGSYVYDLPDKRAPPQYSMTPRREKTAGGHGAVPGVDSPGPGTYAPGERPDVPNLPKWGFGTGKREHVAPSAGPGPGAYRVDKQIGEGPAFSVSGGRKEVVLGGPGSIGGQYTQFGY